MKISKTFLFFILSLGILVFFSGCATAKIPLPTDNFDEMVGIWVNKDYKVRSQKIVIEPDGVYTAYKKIEYTTWSGTGTLEPIEKWTDSKKNIFIKTREFTGSEWVYSINKISNSGTVLEYVNSYKDYPTEINPNDLEYRIYYRQ